MRQAVLRSASGADVLIMAAAVADFAPKRASSSKIKRAGGDLQIDLVANPDIIAEVGEMADGTRPFLVGFAAESDELEANARSKLRDKGLDLIVGNKVGRTLRRHRLRREQGDRLRRGGRAQRLADAAQAAGRRAALGPDRGPLPQGSPAGAPRAPGPLASTLIVQVRARRPRAARRDPRAAPGRRLGRLRPDHGRPARRAALAGAPRQRRERLRGGQLVRQPGRVPDAGRGEPDAAGRAPRPRPAGARRGKPRLPAGRRRASTRRTT